MKNKILLTIILGMFLFSLVNISAFDSHKQNTDFTLTISGNEATACNTTWIKFPNGSSNVLNIPMTKDGTTFYTTIGSGNFSSLGTTCMGLSCTDGSQNEVGSKCLDVTLSGIDPDASNPYVSVGILAILFGIACVFLFLAFKVQESAPKIFFILASFVFLIGCLVASSVIAFDSNLTSGINSTITTMIFAFGLIFIVVFAYIMINQIKAVVHGIGQNKGYEMDF